MGVRRYATKQRDSGEDELRGPERHIEPHPDSLHGRILSMQRSYGNRAVATVIQRRPQSTNAPGKKKPKPSTAKPAATYWPTKRRFPAEGEAALLERANQDAKSDVKNTLFDAAWRYEDYFLLTKNIAVGKPLSDVYKKLGDAARAEFWKNVFLKKVKFGEEAPPPGSDQHA